MSRYLVNTQSIGTQIYCADYGNTHYEKFIFTMAAIVSNSQLHHNWAPILLSGDKLEESFNPRSLAEDNFLFCIWRLRCCGEAAELHVIVSSPVMAYHGAPLVGQHLHSAS